MAIARDSSSSIDRNDRNGHRIAIVLGPDFRGTGGYHFLHLSTGKKIHFRQWSALPMPDYVIGQVEGLGKRDGQPSIGDPKVDIDGNLATHGPITGVGEEDPSDILPQVH